MNRILGRPATTGSIGADGERLAAKHLRKMGYRIAARNFQCGDDEADLIAIDPDGRTVVIVEVKTRVAAIPAPEDQIDRQKQFRLAKIAARIQKRGEYSGRPIRFDAVSIIWPEDGEPIVRHFEAAFDSPF